MTDHGRRPRFVATDVDGTLIDSAEQVPEANRAVIGDLTADGCTFVLATGRPPRWLPQVVEQLPVAPLAVCANGSAVVDTATGELVRTHLLEPELLETLDAVLRERLPGCGVAAERLGRDAADAEFVACPDYRHAWLQPEHLEIGRQEVLAEPVLKLLARMPGWTSGSMVEALGDAVGDLAAVTYSTENGLVEFALPGVTKASTLAELAGGGAASTVASGGVTSSAAFGGVPDSSASDAVPVSVAFGTVPDSSASGTVPFSVAFGDMPNDVEMLRWADHGVAMANALPQVKDAADEVTLSNDEAGLAHVLRRWWP